MENIQNVMTAFAKYNNIHLDNYVSDDYLNEENKMFFFDNYIGNDIFEKNIIKWLSFFEEKDRAVFMDLLSHYRYFTKEKYRKAIKEICGHIMEEIEGESDKVLLVTFPSKKGIASGGDQVRAMLEEILIGKLKKDHIISDTTKLDESVYNGIKYIVFIDDIVGSGTTLFGNVRAVCDKLPLGKRTDIKYFVAMVYANKRKIQRKINELKNKYGIDIQNIFVYENTDKCFDSNVMFEEGTRKVYKTITEYYEIKIEENKLDDDMEIDSILGFQKGQLLVSFHYNTPNNTLSVFWRPSKLSNDPLFIRNKYIRPSISDIRKAKNHCKNNAYLKRKLEHVSENS